MCVGIINASLKFECVECVRSRVLDLCFKNPTIEDDIRSRDYSLN